MKKVAINDIKKKTKWLKLKIGKINENLSTCYCYIKIFSSYMKSTFYNYKVGSCCAWSNWQPKVKYNLAPFWNVLQASKLRQNWALVDSVVGSWGEPLLAS